MSTGPLRRLFGTLGLFALVPTAALLATGAVEPGEAAMRAAVTVLAVVALGRVTNWWLSSAASAFEREADEAGAADAAGAADSTRAPGDDRPQRRRSDGVRSATG